MPWQHETKLHHLRVQHGTCAVAEVVCHRAGCIPTCHTFFGLVHHDVIVTSARPLGIICIHAFTLLLTSPTWTRPPPAFVFHVGMCSVCAVIRCRRVSEGIVL